MVDTMKNILWLLLLPVATMAAYMPDTLPKDAFERIRVGTPTKIWDSQQTYGPDTNFLYQATGLVTWLTNEASSLITARGGLAELRTRQYFRYQPAAGHEIFQTFSFGTATNAICRVGFFDTDQGYYLSLSNNVAYLVERTKVSGTTVETWIPQSSWNVDKFDGTGPSGITVNWTNTQISVWALQWLGVGAVTHFLDIDGKLWKSHVIHTHANELGTVYMQSVNLPLAWSITTAGGVTNSMRAICSAVISSGGQQDEPGFAFSAGNTVDVGITTAGEPVIALRPQGTFSGLTNRTVVVPVGIEILGGGNPAYWELIYGAQVTNGTWVAVSGSACEVNTNGTIIVIGNGRVIDSGYIPASGAVNQRQAAAAEVISKLPLVLDKDGLNPIQLILRVRSTTGTPNVRGAMKWKELR